MRFGQWGGVFNVPFSCRNQDLLNNPRLCVVLQTTRSLLNIQAADDILQQQEELRLVTHVTSCLEISAVRRVQQQQRERKRAGRKSPKNRFQFLGKRFTATTNPRNRWWKRGFRPSRSGEFSGGQLGALSPLI